MICWIENTIQQFKHQLSLALLQAEQLEIISIWSHSFLQTHLNYIQENQGCLYQLHKLSIGQIYTIILSQKGGLYCYRIGDRKSRSIF